jgi:hypothetical protein
VAFAGPDSESLRHRRALLQKGRRGGERCVGASHISVVYAHAKVVRACASSPSLESQLDVGSEMETALSLAMLPSIVRSLQTQRPMSLYPWYTSECPQAAETGF